MDNETPTPLSLADAVPAQASVPARIEPFTAETYLDSLHASLESLTAIESISEEVLERQSLLIQRAEEDPGFLADLVVQANDALLPPLSSVKSASPKPAKAKALLLKCPDGCGEDLTKGSKFRRGHKSVLTNLLTAIERGESQEDQLPIGVRVAFANPLVDWFVDRCGCCNTPLHSDMVKAGGVGPVCLNGRCAHQSRAYEAAPVSMGMEPGGEEEVT